MIYRYLQIRADPDHAGDAAVTDILAAIEALPDLQRSAPLAFSSRPPFPWCHLVLVRCNRSGDHAVEAGLRILSLKRR
jgi:hypothetical protein